MGHVGAQASQFTIASERDRSAEGLCSALWVQQRFFQWNWIDVAWTEGFPVETKLYGAAERFRDGLNSVRFAVPAKRVMQWSVEPASPLVRIQWPQSGSPIVKATERALGKSAPTTRIRCTKYRARHSWAKLPAQRTVGPVFFYIVIKDRCAGTIFSPPAWVPLRPRHLSLRLLSGQPLWLLRIGSSREI